MSIQIHIDPTAPVRRRCGWCREPQDGRGNIMEGEAVTDCLCPKCKHAHFPDLNVGRPTLNVERPEQEQRRAA